MFKERLNQAYPHLIAIAIFSALLLFFFQPAFDDMVLPQHDITQWLGSAKESMDYKELHPDEDVLWNNSMFSGMPNYMIALDYNAPIYKGLVNTLRAIFPPPAYTFLLLMLCSYICLLCFKVRWYIALFGALAFSLCSYNTISISAGHNAKILALAFLMPMIGGFKLLTDKKYLLGTILFSLGITLEIASGHYQITYYCVFILFFLGLTQVVKYIIDKDFKSIGILLSLSILSAIIGVLSNADRLLTTAEYGKYSNRGPSELKVADGDASDGLTKDYVFEYQQNFKDNLSTIVPDFFGGDKYGDWGNPGYYNFYLGGSMIFLCVLGIFVLKKEQVIWIGGTILLGFILASGEDFNSFNMFLYENFPLYSKFRTVNMALAISQIGIVLLASLTLNYFFTNKIELTKDLKKAIIFAFSVPILVILYTFIMDARSSYDAQIPADMVSAVMSDRIGHARSQSFLALFICILTLVILYFTIKSENESNKVYFGLGLCLILVFDVSQINKKFINDDKYVFEQNNAIYPSKTDSYISSKTGEFRVFDLTKGAFSDARPSYFHHSIGGYHAVKLKRYDDLIKRHIGVNNIKVLDMLNVKYAIQEHNKKPIELNPIGNAVFVSSIEKVNSPDEEIDFLDSTLFDARKTAVIDINKFKPSQSQYTNKGEINLVELKPNKVSYKYTSDAKGFAVFSEIFYPEGWTATVDGKEIEIMRANYVLRALELPQGSHNIEFEFKPKSFYLGKTLTLVGNSIFFLLIIGAIVLAYLKSKKDNTINA